MISSLKALGAPSATTTLHESLIMNEQKEVLLMISRYLFSKIRIFWFSIVVFFKVQINFIRELMQRRWREQRGNHSKVHTYFIWSSLKCGPELLNYFIHDDPQALETCTTVIWIDRIRDVKQRQRWQHSTGPYIGNYEKFLEDIKLSHCITEKQLKQTHNKLML